MITNKSLGNINIALKKKKSISQCDYWILIRTTADIHSRSDFYKEFSKSNFTNIVI